MVGNAVIGLYRQRTRARSGPYLSRQWCVDAYAEAACGSAADSEGLAWTARAKSPASWTSPVPQVAAKIDEVLRLFGGKWQTAA